MLQSVQSISIATLAHCALEISREFFVTYFGLASRKTYPLSFLYVQILVFPLPFPSEVAGESKVQTGVEGESK